MFEPNYCDAHPEMRLRVERYGYARNIWNCAFAEEGWAYAAEGVFAVSPNPDNRTSYMVFERDATPAEDGGTWRAPVSGRALRETEDGFLDEDGAFAYPKIGVIACIGVEDGVFIGVRPA